MGSGKHILALMLAAAVPAFGQTTVHEPPEKPKEDLPEWSASAKSGFLLSAGNARSLSLSASTQLGYKWKGNKLSFDGGIAYARSEVKVAADVNGSGVLEPEEIQAIVQTTTQLWNLQGRYDRFFSATNAAFLTGKVLSDEPAGKELLVTAQAGYSRQLVKTARQEALAEIGYDFTSEKLTAAESAFPIHSARALFGYAVKVTETTGANVKVELLVNLNEERAPNVRGGDVVGPFGDTRVNAQAGLNFALLKNLTFGVGATLRYDHAPAPLAPLPIPYAPGFVPFAEPLDLITEAQVIFTFL